MTTRELIHMIEPLLGVSLKYADIVGNDEIRISKARARELYIALGKAKMELKEAANNRSQSRLDRIFGNNADTFSQLF